MKKKLDIKKLKYPIWFDSIFFCLTVLIPIILVVIEGLKVPSFIFKLSFMTLCTATIVWFFIQKFWLDKIRTKLIAKQTALEHDYSIDVGNPQKIKCLWYQNEQTLSVFNMLSVLLYGGLAVLILMGVATTFMKIRLTLIIVMTLYVIAYTLKFMVIIVKKGADENE